MLRTLGAGLGALSCLAIATLLRINPPPPPANPGVVAYGLAAAGFLCASLGSALMFLGRHIFDEIPISSRWGSYRTAEVQPREQDAASIQPISRPASSPDAGLERPIRPKPSTEFPERDRKHA